jgi:hypothetical protein
LEFDVLYKYHPIKIKIKFIKNLKNRKMEIQKFSDEKEITKEKKEIKNEDLRKIWTLISKEEKSKNWETTVSIKTRLEPSSEEIPESLYAPINYQITVLVKNVEINSQILLAKISVIDSETNEPILKNGKTIMTGPNEFALNSSGEKEFKSSTKLKFTDCSFHHLKKGFSWLLTIYMPNETQVLFSQKSPNFKVFARKPSKGGKKRKFDEITIQTQNDIIQSSLSLSLSKVDERKGQSDGGGPGNNNNNNGYAKEQQPTLLSQRPLEKKMKTNEISEFKEFAMKLEELLNYSKNLDLSSKKFCVDFAVRNFLILDPPLTQNILMSQNSLQFDNSIKKPMVVTETSNTSKNLLISNKSF